MYVNKNISEALKNLVFSKNKKPGYRSLPPEPKPVNLLVDIPSPIFDSGQTTGDIFQLNFIVGSPITQANAGLTTSWTPMKGYGISVTIDELVEGMNKIYPYLGRFSVVGTDIYFSSSYVINPSEVQLYITWD